ncbi:HAD-IIIC family phosphatase [bacterium C-53]|nr:HAD-IIIC family phosphatase [Lachnospiraceae bacterium]NBI04456.1 HAD-IIIC family phosphatase [Lachnospiraceae bacterium]RKJ08130.1 HAD-IIIC family phosphatase [bacterium C-53]
MDWFGYPLNTKLLYRKKAKIKRELSNKNNLLNKKVAVLGGSTTNEIVKQLEIFLLYYGISAEFYQSEYGQYWQDAMFGTSELDTFEPDIIYIHTNWRNIKTFPEMKSSKEEVSQMLDTEYQRFEIMWKTLDKKFKCPIIQNNFDRPNYRLLGNRDIWDYRGRSNFIACLNQKFYDYAQKQNNFYINDLDYLAQDYGLSEWNNALYWHMYKCAMCMEAIPHVAQSVANIIKSIYGKNKKVLILDLDNTIWGGIIGDDGVEGIQVGQEVPKGQVFSEFQQYCKNLKSIGVVLAINSKNEMENALAGLNHPDGVLNPDDFVSIKANWNSKDQNLQEIAKELTLSIDSFVFVDDNPAERELVSVQMPEVAVPSLDTAENYIKVMDHGGYFEVTALSQEDMKKTEMYHARIEAGKAAVTFANYGEYLDSLQMTIQISDFKSIYMQRIAQLVNKSNQFNLTTLRYTEDDIRDMQDDLNYMCLCGKLIDKFGDNGLVTVVIGQIKDDVLHIKLWLMSCRVLKREVEDTIMNAVVEEAKRRGISKIIGYYYPTSKNIMVEEFYGIMGYTKVAEDKNGNVEWELNVDQYNVKLTHMKVDNLGL